MRSFMAFGRVRWLAAPSFGRVSRAAKPLLFAPAPVLESARRKRAVGVGDAACENLKWF